MAESPTETEELGSGRGTGDVLRDPMSGMFLPGNQNTGPDGEHRSPWYEFVYRFEPKHSEKHNRKAMSSSLIITQALM